jgi:ABC-type transporter Mla MlaB component
VMSGDELNINVHNLVLSGPVTLYESSEVRESLLSAVSEGKDLRLDLETTGPWDLAGVQLLVSVVASGRKSGQSVRFVNVPGVCREIAERSGLADWLCGVSDSLL